MSEYLFADKCGEIAPAEYDGSTLFSAEQVLASLDSAFNMFPFPACVERVKDYGDVFHVTFPKGNDGIGEVFICAKGTAPGGRSGRKDEQRIQPKAKYLNYVYDRAEEGKKAVFLGVYNRDGETIFCTWKVTASDTASDETPSSRQIKITSIANAMKEGFAQQDKGRGEYACAFRPEFLYFYLRNCDWLHTGQVSELAEHTTPENFGAAEDTADDNGFEKVNFHTGIKCKYPRNRIVFGAPGTGKSFRLKEDCCALLANTTGGYERVTFHPDYTFSQFVGAYKPVTDREGNIRYDFVPGPFMRVYVKAIKSGRTEDPQPFVLIVEEINRARVAAVFGDVFQLLDRDALGASEYEIEASEDIRKYLADKLGGEPDDYCRIRIPDNMFIWASMNSADQGVFPMDTAFKRRWSFEYLGINENEAKIKGRITLGKNDSQVVEWNTLRKAINEKLAAEYRVNEDKLMGPFFLPKTALTTVSDTDDTIADADLFLDTFKSKVIMYLYEDAARQHKHKLFAGCPDTTKYSAVCEAFDKIGMHIFGEDFVEKYYDPQKG